MKIDEPSLSHVACLIVSLRKGHLSWFWVLNEVHVFDQVFEAQCVGLSCIQLTCRLCFSGDGIQLCMYVSIC